MTAGQAQVLQILVGADPNGYPNKSWPKLSPSKIVKPIVEQNTGQHHDVQTLVGTAPNGETLQHAGQLPVVQAPVRKAK